MFTFPECTLLSQFHQFQSFCFPKQYVISFEVSGPHNTISVTGHFSFSAAIYYLTSINLCFNEQMFSRWPLLLLSLSPGASVCIVLVWLQCVCVCVCVWYGKMATQQEENPFLIYKSQQDAHVTEFILSDNCSTCFGRRHHPSSGAQNNCNYSIF